MFSKLKVGDKVKIVFCNSNGHERDRDGNPCTKWNSKVVEIRKDTLIVEFVFDKPRKSIFNKQTGIDILGKEYGYLEFHKNK